MIRDGIRSMGRPWGVKIRNGEVDKSRNDHVTNASNGWREPISLNFFRLPVQRVSPEMVEV